MAHFGGRITAKNNIDMLWYPPHIVWKLLKMSHFLTFFYLIDLSGNTVWLQATQNVAFKILAFFIKYMLNETFSVIFGHCATSYLIPESWLIISFRLKNRLHLAVFYTHHLTKINIWSRCLKVMIVVFWMYYVPISKYTAIFHLTELPKLSSINTYMTVYENYRKVSFKIASEASYVYILCGQKLIKIP